MEATELPKKLNDLLTSREAFVKSVNVQQLHEYVQATMAELLNVASALGSVANGSKLAEVVRNDKDSQHKGVAIYVKLLSGLTAKGKEMESSSTFSLLKEAATVYAGIMKDLDDKLDTFFKSSAEINLFNSRLSHVVILGAITEAGIVGKYCSYLLSCLSSEISGDIDVAPYRYKYLEERAALMTGILDRVVTKTSYNFNAIIEDMKSRGIDPFLLDKFGAVDITTADVSKTSPEVRGFLSVNPLRFFQYLGEKYSAWRHSAYQERKTHQDWMESHVSLLKMKLDGVSPETPEYKRLVGIIEKYEDMINDIARANQSYEASN